MCAITRPNTGSATTRHWPRAWPRKRRSFASRAARFTGRNKGDYMNEANPTPGKNFRFPTPSPPHIAYIKDRPRNSGLTSLRFIAGNRFVCCDFNEKTMYLAQYDGVKVEIVATARTVVADGTPVQTDLLDVNAEGLLVTSNFYQGTQSFFQLKDDRLAFVAEMKLNAFIRCHGVRFVPGYDDLLWITYCGKDNKAVVIADYRRQKVLHML